MRRGPCPNLDAPVVRVSARVGERAEMSPESEECLPLPSVTSWITTPPASGVVSSSRLGRTSQDGGGSDGRRWRSPWGRSRRVPGAGAARHTGVPAQPVVGRGSLSAARGVPGTHDRAGYGRSDRRHGRRLEMRPTTWSCSPIIWGSNARGLWWSGAGLTRWVEAPPPRAIVRATCMVGGAPLGPPGLEREEWLTGPGSREREGVRLGDGGRGCPVP